MSPFFRLRSPLEKYAKQIRGILASLGVDPDGSRFLDQPEAAGWLVSRGSVTVIIGVRIGDEGGDGWFSVSASLVFLPEGDLLPLYRRLLELNTNQLFGASLGADGNVIAIRADRRLKGMDSKEAEEMIRRVAAYADWIDDELHEEFGAPFWTPGD